ncbi:hypothetical protein EYC80_000689 [Monilinia laxa]|uniref:Uncharacterized protein n=1 Tax=Monilinia laxa TaxID=61186 RepID=A0A5N6KBJ1_MONLA|nr:hypothetical protein EYC80_000689 [Monilinia laxa]
MFGSACASVWQKLIPLWINPEFHSIYQLQLQPTPIPPTISLTTIYLSTYLQCYKYQPTIHQPPSANITPTSTNA